MGGFNNTANERNKMKKWIAKITGGVEIDVRAAGLFGAINSIIQALRPGEEILELKPLTGGR